MDTTTFTRTTDDVSFDADVLKNSKITLVDFWAPWCGPCKAIAPVLEEIARDHADVLDVVKLNTDENPAVTGKLGITSIPTLHVYKDGEIVKTIVGALPKPKLLRELEPFLA
ncbi:thioredoxin [Knoellia sp. CPCC 206453]|uniref:thioredoxin n=1 Tax=Knoellia pratensis TaxID=3404796 RepID=UPI003616DA17